MSYANSWSVLSSMRQMAWESAKGELRSMYCTNWCADVEEEGKKQRERRNKFEEFIRRTLRGEKWLTIAK